MVGATESLARALPTSTQKGAIAELIVAAGILEASNGRLSPFKPIADDDGLDLLILNKATRRILPLQIKCRRSFDNPSAQTVEFDIRLQTFVAEADGLVLCVRLEGLDAKTFWLIPSSQLTAVARERNGKLIVVASAKDTSADRFSAYRVTSFQEVVERMAVGTER
jgi:hypothetical protein